MLLPGDGELPGVCIPGCAGDKAFPISFGEGTCTEGLATGLTCADGGLMTSVLS